MRVVSLLLKVARSAVAPSIRVEQAAEIAVAELARLEDDLSLYTVHMRRWLGRWTVTFWGRELECWVVVIVDGADGEILDTRTSYR
ncbi:MAG: hypothetical protein HZB16_17810 [Armatimonadetes bacterium]|nr:hypothetical protein [Armatimonadota bacterium]